MLFLRSLGPLETRKSLHYRAKSNCLELAPPGSAPWPSFSLGLRTDFGVGERERDFTARLCFVFSAYVFRWFLRYSANHLNVLAYEDFQ